MDSPRQYGFQSLNRKRDDLDEIWRSGADCWSLRRFGCTQSRTPVPAAAPRAVAAAQVFLATLDSAQRAKASLPLNATTRTVWSNLPTGIKMQVGATERNGLKFGSMNAASRTQRSR